MTSPQQLAQRYAVEHETRYAYTAPVSQSWQLARLTPRVLPWQKLLSHSLTIDPAPDERRDELDSFGNTVTHFGLHGAHRVLRVRMECLVEVTQRPVVEAAMPLMRRPGQMQMHMQARAQTQTQTQMQMQAQAELQSQTQ